MTTIEVEQRDPQPVLSIRQTVPVAELTQAQGASLYELWRLLHDRGVAPTGPPFVRYHTFGDVDTDVETGVPVGDAVAGADLPGRVAWWSGRHDRAPWRARPPRRRLQPDPGMASDARATGRSRLGGLRMDRPDPGAGPVKLAGTGRAVDLTGPHLSNATFDSTLLA